MFTRRHPRPGWFRESGRGAVTNVAGAICIGQVVALYTTMRGGGGGRGGNGAPLEGTKGVPLFSLSGRFAHRVASRRVLHALYVFCIRNTCGR